MGCQRLDAGWVRSALICSDGRLRTLHALAVLYTSQRPQLHGHQDLHASGCARWQAMVSKSSFSQPGTPRQALTLRLNVDWSSWTRFMFTVAWDWVWRTKNKKKRQKKQERDREETHQRWVLVLTLDSSHDHLNLQAIDACPHPLELRKLSLSTFTSKPCPIGSLSSCLDDPFWAALSWFFSPFFFLLSFFILFAFFGFRFLKSEQIVLSYVSRPWSQISGWVSYIWYLLDLMVSRDTYIDHQIW